ncbi:hypothetical protein Q7P37_010113 [Cladosporium fusiforme]
MPKVAWAASSAKAAAIGALVRIVLLIAHALSLLDEMSRRVRVARPCDEQTPTCTRCLKRGEKCSFLTTPADSDSPNSHSNSNGTPHECLQEQHDRHLLELELMHHWTTSTYLTVSYNHPKNNAVLTGDLCRSALAHEYLLDGIFSFTALHLAYENHSDPATAEHYVSAAISLRNRGLQRAAPAMQDFHLRTASEPDASEVFALFWFSAFAGMITMAVTVVTRRDPSSFASPDAAGSKFPFISMQVEMAQLWRGTRAIMDIASTMGVGMDFGTDPPAHGQKGNDGQLDAEIEARLSQLQSLNDKAHSPGPSDSAEVMLCRESVRVLRAGYAAWASGGNLNVLMSWSTAMGNEFALMLRDEAHLPLLNAMCYGALFGITQLISGRWWMKSAGKALVDECSIALAGCPEDWLDLIRWARVTVELPAVDTPVG